MTDTCDILPPRRPADHFGKTEGCALPIGHAGPHRCITEHQGTIDWEDDLSCGCCAPDEHDRCFTWSPLTHPA